MKIKALLQEIDKLKKELDVLSPIEEVYKNNLMKKVHLEWTFHSCKLEGNELSYGETRELLEYGQGSKRPYKDQREIKGHEEAILLVEDIAQSSRQLSESFIRELNLKILKEPYTIKTKTSDGKVTTKTIYPGEYKTTPNHVETKSGDKFKFAEPFEVPAKMQELVDWYANEDELHPLVKAIELHYRFIRIHPFDDGNGRVSRLLMNYCLMSNKLPPVIIKSHQKDLYFSGLRQADAAEFESLYEFLGNGLADSLKLYISAAKGEDINEPSDLDKRLKIFSSKLTQDDKDVIKLQRSKEVIAERFEDSIWPFFESVYNSTHKFYRLFADHELQYMVDRTTFSGTREISLPEIKEKFKEAISETDHLKELGIEIRLIAFKFVPEKPKTVFLKTNIEFQDHLYIINPHHNGNKNLPEIKKLYDRPLYEKEIEDYVNKDGNSILEELESYHNANNQEE
ncbi:Fic family protein [Rhodohalobacter halophilus]|uniref:Fic family protein n=1 Tax=Rhodohalobacter halophilus TaxID=1812810 RepID=UPI00083F7635|nr:Fic family protein [Rhodohalobacter halophilus]